jgi:uncharacterized YigZ family protein
MSADRFLTIKTNSQGLFKDKGSKFISFAFRVNSEVEILEKIELIRKEYYDARHHCYAWLLGPGQDKFRTNDDGEPGHTAGDPILGQIRSRYLTNVLVVVVRYFGGIKLGVSGLINAYKTSTSDALDNAEFKYVTITTTLKITYPYENTASVLRIVDEFSMEIEDQEFSENCTMKSKVAKSKLDALIDKVDLLRNTGSEIQIEILD